MVLGHDLLIPNEDTRVYREALALIKAGYEVTVFCWSRRLEKYDTKWEVERDGIKVVRIFEDLKGGFFSKVKSFRKALKKLEEKVTEYEPDLIHAHDLEVLDVAVNIKNYIGNGGFLFAMCSATDSYDIALASGNLDIVDQLIDNTPTDNNINNLIDFNKTLAFSKMMNEPADILISISLGVISGTPLSR